ncbi:MAG: cytochrome C biogenesis protein, partial [Candidatus Neomarinimicrobiota bacterium]
NFTMLKVDLTFGGDSLKENLKVKYSIKGVPTVIFITKEGKERKDLRLFGFEEPQKFLRRMKELLD